MVSTLVLNGPGVGFLGCCVLAVVLYQYRCFVAWISSHLTYLYHYLYVTRLYLSSTPLYHYYDSDL